MEIIYIVLKLCTLYIPDVPPNLKLKEWWRYLVGYLSSALNVPKAQILFPHDKSSSSSALGVSRAWEYQ